MLGCPVSYQTTGDPMDFFCQDRPSQLDWSRIVIRKRPPGLAGGTIVVRNTATGTVLQTIQVGPNQADTLYSISSVPYATNHTLTVEFTPAYAPNAAPAAYALEVQFTANAPPQICYQARVVRCGPITNTATFGPLSATPPPALQAPWTKSDTVNLGPALSGPCDPCAGAAGDSLDLSIRKRALFPPWQVGGLGEFEIVTTVQQGVLVPFNAPAPTFVDHLPAGLTFHSFTGAPLWSCVATGQQVACTYNGPAVPAGQALPAVTIAVNVVGPEGTLTNCAVLGPDASLANNRSCVEVVLAPCPVDLAIRKEAFGTPWIAGGTGVFQVRVGVVQGTYTPATSPGATFTDVLPAGVAFQSFTPQGPWSCTASGQQVTCKYNGPPVAAPNQLPPVQITVGLGGKPGPIVNCALLPADVNLQNNRGCVEVGIFLPPVPADTLDLAIRKEAVPGPWSMGGVGVFRIRVSVAQGTLAGGGPTPTFVDVLPAGVTFQSYSGQPNWLCTVAGQQVSCTWTGASVQAPGVLPDVLITVRVVGVGTVANCAGLRPDLEPGNNRSCAEVVLRPPLS
jgi:hypothetical protein